MYKLPKNNRKMTETDKLLLIQAIDSLEDIGGTGKKILKLLVYNKGEKITQHFLCKALEKTPSTVAGAINNLKSINLVVQEGAYKGCTFDLNRQEIDNRLQQYIRKQSLINQMKS